MLSKFIKASITKEKHTYLVFDPYTCLKLKFLAFKCNEAVRRKPNHCLKPLSLLWILLVNDEYYIRLTLSFHASVT